MLQGSWLGFFVFVFVFVFLAALLGMQDLKSLIMEQTLAPPNWKPEFLTTGPPGKSRVVSFLKGPIVR